MSLALFSRLANIALTLYDACVQIAGDRNGVAGCQGEKPGLGHRFGGVNWDALGRRERSGVAGWVFNQTRSWALSAEDLCLESEIRKVLPWEENPVFPDIDQELRFRYRNSQPERTRYRKELRLREGALHSGTTLWGT